MDRNQNEKIFVDSVVRCFSDALIEKIAVTTKGLSYSELEGIFNSIKTEVDILDRPIVNKDLIEIIVERCIKKHKDFTGEKYLGLIED